MIFQEALPVAHTWFRTKKDNECECSWIPLYKSCKEALGKQAGDGVLARTDSALSSLGIVLNRPAAQLDLWGLVVMAYSNGSWCQLILSTGGGFRAVLHAKNFALTISQGDVNSFTTGSLEPREHPAEDREPLGVDETSHLFAHGNYMSSKDVLLGWPLNGDLHTEPTQELVEGRWDKQLKKGILDYFAAYDIGKRIRDAITEYRAKWVRFLCKRDEESNAAIEPFSDITTELYQIQERHLRAIAPQPIPKEGGNGVEAHQVNGDEIDGPYSSETEVGNLPKEQAKSLESLRSLIDVQLWRIKFLFYDNVELVDNLNHRDALEIFRERGQLLEKITV